MSKHELQLICNKYKIPYETGTKKELTQCIGNFAKCGKNALIAIQRQLYMYYSHHPIFEIIRNLPFYEPAQYAKFPEYGNITKLKIEELREILETYYTDTTGTKVLLTQRLQEFMDLRNLCANIFLVKNVKIYMRFMDYMNHTNQMQFAVPQQLICACYSSIYLNHKKSQLMQRLMIVNGKINEISKYECIDIERKGETQSGIIYCIKGADNCRIGKTNKSDVTELKKYLVKKYKKIMLFNELNETNFKCKFYQSDLNCAMCQITDKYKSARIDKSDMYNLQFHEVEM
jgi:hypothetical protein